MKTTYTRTEVCDICPWRQDTVGVSKEFPFLERMKECVETGFNAVFECPRSPAWERFVCVGYLMSPQSQNNATVRLALSRRKYDPKTLNSAAIPLFSTYQEMTAAHGVEVQIRDEPPPTRNKWRTYEAPPQTYTVRHVGQLQIQMSEWLAILGDDRR